MAEYRALRGRRPCRRKWALGLWQCKERYQTQQEWLDIAEEYRTRQEPMDNLVQDWFYWDPYPWGSHKLDPKRYPDPAAAIAPLHDRYHLHFMISVWGKFYPGSPDNPDANYDAMNAHGYLYPPGRTAPATTTPSTPPPAPSTGASCATRSSPRAWTPGGWTPRAGGGHAGVPAGADGPGPGPPAS